MYNNEDRSWTYERIGRSGYLSTHFEEGVLKFLEFAFSQTQMLDRGKAKCPCSKCCNSKYLKKDDIMKHLYNKGFVPQYHVWVAHGEIRNRYVEASNTYVGESSGHNAEDYNAVSRYRDMVDDAFGGHFENIYYNQVENEEPNEEAQSFFELLHASEVPIHEGVDTTVLDWVSKFMTNKTNHTISGVACDNMIEQAHSLLTPEARRGFPNSVYEMKKLLRTLGLGYKIFDVCVNNCFLFYGEYESKNYTACPQCHEERYEVKHNPNNRNKRIPRKKLWYFPLNPRLQRLYMSRITSEHMTWHLKCRENNDVMIHPASGVAWKYFDETYPDYAAEARNVRLGICTDGFTPWGNSSTPYSCWPVFVTPYNLPPDLCMRQEYIFLTLLISGPKSPGKNIDVMLRPLIDELRSLWESGVQTYDSFRRQNFQMRASVLWTISDFPGYGMLSQWSTHGRLSCPYCMEKTKSFQLQHGRKTTFFDCHRRFLPHEHPWRMNRRDFIKGRIETDAPLLRRSGADMWRHVKDLPPIGFGTSREYVEGFGVSHNWCRRSIFWELPYWATNLLRHNLDVMHCEKNFFDNIKNTVMDDSEKTKDNMNARRDLELLTNRRELFLQEAADGKVVKRKAVYCLSKEQKVKVCEWLCGLQFPDGYASNMSRCVQLQQLRLTGMKSHDCHVFMQRLIPIAFRDFLPDSVWGPLVEVSLFFKALCAPEIRKSDMEQLEKSIVLTMCKLERIFPPSFFDSMEHLAIHLPWEAKVGGPVQYRWMYPFERRMLELKRSVTNRARVEGSICEAYLTSEVTNFLSHYFERSFETRANRLNRNEEGLASNSIDQLSVFQKKGRPLGSVSYKQLTIEEYKTVQIYVLLNCSEVDGWLRLFDAEMCVGFSQYEINQRRNLYFAQWFKDWVKSDRNICDHRIHALGMGPSRSARTYKGYIINGFRFHTESHGRGRKRMNSGVYVKASSGEPNETNFYGMLQEVLEVDYWGSGHQQQIVLFMCDWYDITRGMVVHPTYGLVDINPRTRLSTGSSEPYILANQAQQVYYTEYPSQQNLRRRGWWAVCTTRARYIVDTTSLADTEVGSVQEATTVYQDNTAAILRSGDELNENDLLQLGDVELLHVYENQEQQAASSEEEENDED